MLQYQLSMTLADMRIRELVAEAERHALLAAARREAADTSPWSPRLKNVATRMLAWLHAPREATVRSTETPMTGAGPIGCSA